MKTSHLFGLVLSAAVMLTHCHAAGTARMTHGPLAGAVTDTAGMVWARTNQAAQVKVRYSTDAALAHGTESEAMTSSAASDFTTNVKITNLAAEQTYYYNVLVDGVAQLASPYPHFKTFAPRGQATPFQFVILTDFRTVSKITQPVSTFKTAPLEKPDFVIIGGDFDHRNPTTIDEKRQMFRDLYTPANGMEDFTNLILHNFALVHFWDDHDYGANNSDKTYPDKSLSFQVLQEYFPLYPLPPAVIGDWQSFSYGSADFFVLDARSQRDPPLERDSAAKSMLDGDELGTAGQWAWLLNGLKNSRAKWKFIISPVILNPTTKERDGWGAYPTERRRLLENIHTNNITGVIVLSGDLHAGAIDDGTNAGLPEMVTPTANDGFDQRCLTEPSGNVGTWSVGSYGDASGTPCNGYGVVHVLTDPDRVQLEVKDSDGKTRVTYLETLNVQR